MRRPLHSIVVPVFNEEQGLRHLHRRLTKALSEPLSKREEAWEVIFVNDGSSDRSEKILTDLRQEDPEHVRLISFSRNFGHQAAITAGIDHAAGDTVIVMDADLQDPPEVIIDMLAKWREGVDVVYGVRAERKNETWFKKATAALFYRLLRSSTDLDIPAGAGDFRLMSRRAARALSALRERHRFLRGMSRWVGFKQAAVTYVRESRFAGETKYPLRRMVHLAWDAITGFSLLPLRIATYTGLSAALLGVLGALGPLAARVLMGEPIQAWWLLMAAIFFFGGLQLAAMGVLGEYVGRVLEEAKRRPLYVVDYTLGLPAQAEHGANAAELPGSDAAVEPPRPGVVAETDAPSPHRSQGAAG